MEIKCSECGYIIEPEFFNLNGGCKTCEDQKDFEREFNRISGLNIKKPELKNLDRGFDDGEEIRISKLQDEGSE